MRWLKTWKFNRAAKAYALRLPPRLAQDYGGEGPYTVGQIDTAVRALALNPAYVAFGYAIFLDRAAYEDIKPSLVNPVDLVTARALYDHYKPWAPAPSDEFVPAPLRFYGIGAPPY